MPLKWTKVSGKPHMTSPDYFTPLVEPVRIGSQVATQIKRWYNSSTHDWVVSYADAKGRQVGLSTYVYSLNDAEDEASYLLVQAAEGKVGEPVHS